jgi:hypothetical protein
MTLCKAEVRRSEKILKVWRESTRERWVDVKVIALGRRECENKVFMAYYIHSCPQVKRQREEVKIRV